MLGINQSVLMVLATVIIAGLIGGGALGLEALGGFQKPQPEDRVMAGGRGEYCLVGDVLDRITQAWGNRSAPENQHIVNMPRNVGDKRGNIDQRRSTRAAALRGVVRRVCVRGRACGGDDETTCDRGTTATVGDRRRGTEAPAASGEAGAGAIKLAINPWTGSAVNAKVAKVVLESPSSNTPTGTRRDRRVRRRGPAQEDGSSTPSSRSGRRVTPPTTRPTSTRRRAVVDMGLLGPTAKIGWYVPTFVVDEHPELATWEGFKDPDAGQVVRDRRDR